MNGEPRRAGRGPGGSGESGGAHRRLIPYPTDHLLAVLDDPSAAERCAAALRAAGFADGDVVVLGSSPGDAGFDSLAARHRGWTRLLRVLQFLTMDQMPDLVLYEAALADGRSVVAVHARERSAVLAARSVVVGAGGHFVNHFGRTSTEEFDRWRGPELELPELMRR